MEPAEFRVILGHIVDPTGVPKRLELHGMKFERGRIWKARDSAVGVGGPVAAGEVGVDVERPIAVVFDQLFDK